MFFFFEGKKLFEQKGMTKKSEILSNGILFVGEMKAVWIGGWMDEWMDGWMEVWMDGWMDG